MTVETKNKVYLASLVLVGVLAVVGLAQAFSGKALINIETWNGDLKTSAAEVSEGMNLGSAQTTALNVDNPDTVTNLDSLFLWGTGSRSGLEVAGTAHFGGAVNVTGTITARGDTRAASFVQTGSVTTLTASSTVTAAQACDSRVWNLVPPSTTPTYVLPTADSLFLDCLTTNGDKISVSVFNNSLTSTLFSAGTSSTLEWSRASSTVGLLAGVSAELTMFRTSTAGGYKALLTIFAD